MASVTYKFLHRKPSPGNSEFVTNPGFIHWNLTRVHRGANVLDSGVNVEQHAETAMQTNLSL
jgi:hypothetical protein